MAEPLLNLHVAIHSPSVFLSSCFLKSILSLCYPRPNRGVAGPWGRFSLILPWLGLCLPQLSCLHPLPSFCTGGSPSLSCVSSLGILKAQPLSSYPTIACFFTDQSKNQLLAGTCSRFPHKHKPNPQQHTYLKLLFSVSIIMLFLTSFLDFWLNV